MTDKLSIARTVVRKLQHAGYPVRKSLSADARKALGPDSSGYSESLMQSLWDYINGNSGLGTARIDFQRAMVEAFTNGFDAGYQDGGGELPTTPEANDWLNNRVEDEMANIDRLFYDLKTLRKDDTFDPSAWISDRSAGYTASLNDVYSMGMVFGKADEALTFDGDDGKESCQTCQDLKGQTHPASWWIENDLIPTQGNENFICGGWNCYHGLKDKAGNWVTLNPDVYKSMKSTEIKSPPQIAEDPRLANVKWLEKNNPRVSLYATGLDIDGSPMFAYVVDGPLIRTNLWIDFTAGGNHSRYPWVPEHEYWLDVSNAAENETEAEADYDLIHETAEDRDMRENGHDYGEAHSRVANPLEYAARNEGKTQELLTSQGWQTFFPIVAQVK
jgi:hypothetical protein